MLAGRNGDPLLRHRIIKFYLINSALTRRPTRPFAEAALASPSRRRANPRLSLISRHFDNRLPLPELNTPFSSERLSVEPDDVEYKPIERPLPPLPAISPTTKATMSSQTPHNTLLIPGPIEFDDAVLQSMSHYA